MTIKFPLQPGIFLLLALISACSEHPPENNERDQAENLDAAQKDASLQRAWTLSFDFPETFEDVPEEWTALADGSHLAEFSVVESGVLENSGALRVHLAQVENGNAWQVQAYREGIPVNPGELYYYSLWAKGDRGTKLRTSVENQDFSTIESRTLLMTGDWQEIAMDFIASDSSIRTPIHFAFPENSEATIYIDSVSLVAAKNYDVQGEVR